MALNPLNEFLHNYCLLGQFVQPLSEFKKAYGAYTRQRGIHNAPFRYTLYSDVFSPHDIIVCARPGEQDPHGRRPYIAGLKLSPLASGFVLQT